MTPLDRSAYIRDRLFEGSILRQKTISQCGLQISDAARTITECFQAGGKLLLFGNGGSAADAEHIAAEFLGWYQSRFRGPLPAYALASNAPTLTAIANDSCFENVFRRQVEALGNKGDVAIGISTSGNSVNVWRGIREANTRGLTTVGLTGGLPITEAVIQIAVPSDNTPLIQEVHMAIGHIICGLVEKELTE